MPRPIGSFEVPVDELRRLRHLGHSYTEIVRATGAGRATVSRHCRGIRPPLKSGPKRKPS
jgi:DNA invertase Pin-like site-specific DNA recombinase